MHIRKAILTGGGRATRLFPITTTINKHLLPLANKPIIFHAIEKAVEAGVTEIFINTNPGETELQKFVGDGGHWGIDIHFFEQTGGPQGIAHVVNEAKQFIGNDPFLFYLSDNIILASIKDFVDEFSSGNHDAMIALARVENPNAFGVPVFDENNRLIDTLEKPEHPPNNFAITGMYLFGPELFFDAFNNIQKSARGEYEIPSIFSYLIKTNRSVGHKEITGWWKDTGKVDDLLVASQLLLDQKTPLSYILPPDDLSHVNINGQVHIGIGTKILDNVMITGPVIIGENCILENCSIGPYVTVGQGVTIREATIQNVIILDNTHIECPISIHDSLIGKNVVIKKREDLHVTHHKMVVGDKTILEF